MCCGKSRAQFRGTMSNLPPPRFVRSASSAPQLARRPSTTFEYIGRTRLTVAGPVTGREYRFDRMGARVEVDPRDTPSIAAIPLLKQV